MSSTMVPALLMSAGVSDDSEDCVACGLRNLVKAYHDVRVTESHVNALSKKIHKLFGRCE
jgi:hypothetical protein